MKDKLAVFSLPEFASIGQFFSRHIDDAVNGVTIRMMPNDFARPVYSVIIEHLDELVPQAKPIAGTDGIYSLYDLNLVLKDLQRKENSIRLEYLPAVVKFNDVVDIPQEIDDMPNGPEKLELALNHCNGKLRKISDKALTAEEYMIHCRFDARLRHPSQKGQCLVNVDLERARGIYARFGFM